MADSEYDFDELEDEFGITFGLGIDFEAQYEAFRIYSAYGGQDEDGATNTPLLER
jgi:hypothetical protein